VCVCVAQGCGADTRSPDAQRVGGRDAVPSGGATHGQAVRGRVRVRGRRAGQCGRSGRGGCGGVVGFPGRGRGGQLGDGGQKLDGTTPVWRRRRRRRRRRRAAPGDGVAAGAEPQRLRDRQRAERVQRQSADGRPVPAGRRRRGDHRGGQQQVGQQRRRYRFAQVAAGVQQLRPVADHQRRDDRPHAAAAPQLALPAPALQPAGAGVPGRRERFVVAVVAAVRQHAVPRQHVGQPVRGLAAQKETATATAAAPAQQAEQQQIRRQAARAVAVGVVGENGRRRRTDVVPPPQDRGRRVAVALRSAVHRHTRVERHHGHRVHQLGHPAAVVRNQHRPRQEQLAVSAVRGGRARPGGPGGRQHAVRLDPAGQAVLLPGRARPVRRRAVRATVRRRLPDHVLRLRRFRARFRRRGRHHGRHNGRHAGRGAAVVVVRHIAVLQRSRATHRAARGRLHIRDDRLVPAGVSRHGRHTAVRRLHVAGDSVPQEEPSPPLTGVEVATHVLYDNITYI